MNPEKPSCTEVSHTKNNPERSGLGSHQTSFVLLDRLPSSILVGFTVCLRNEDSRAEQGAFPSLASRLSSRGFLFDICWPSSFQGFQDGAVRGSLKTFT